MEKSSLWRVILYGELLSIQRPSLADVAWSMSVLTKKIEFFGDQKRVSSDFGFHFPPLALTHFSLSPGNERHPVPPSVMPTHRHSSKSDNVVHRTPPVGPHWQCPPDPTASHPSTTTHKVLRSVVDKMFVKYLMKCLWQNLFPLNRCNGHEFPGMVNLFALDDHYTVHFDGFAKLGLVCFCKFYQWSHFLFLLWG